MPPVRSWSCIGFDSSVGGTGTPSVSISQGKCCAVRVSGDFEPTTGAALPHLGFSIDDGITGRGLRLSGTGNGGTDLPSRPGGLILSGTLVVEFKLVGTGPGCKIVSTYFISLAFSGLACGFLGV